MSKLIIKVKLGPDITVTGIESKSTNLQFLWPMYTCTPHLKSSCICQKISQNIQLHIIIARVKASIYH